MFQFFSFYFLGLCSSSFGCVNSGFSVFLSCLGSWGPSCQASSGFWVLWSTWLPSHSLVKACGSGWTCQIPISTNNLTSRRPGSAQGVQEQRFFCYSHPKSQSTMRSVEHIHVFGQKKKSMLKIQQQTSVLLSMPKSWAFPNFTPKNGFDNSKIFGPAHVLLSNHKIYKTERRIRRLRESKRVKQNHTRFPGCLHTSHCYRN